MNFKHILLIVCVLYVSTFAHAQAKVLGECTIQFNIQQQQKNEWVEIGSKKVWIKGNQCKTTLTTPQLVQTLIFNIQQDKAVVTKEVGNNKYLQEIIYPSANLATLISMKEIPTDTITLLGYPCKKVKLQLSDGVVYEVYYTTDLIPSVTTFEFAFKEVQGLVLGYNIVNKNNPLIKYSATLLDLSPITLNQFQINKSEFQILD
ncbi:MAG: hypothetical protein NWS87_08270 [Sediminibacterium sp.]|jgi:hypothetical protein|nr:hypothetical protein [Sediminibacterium sp.]